MRERKVHFGDLLYNRACCGSESKLIAGAESEVTCLRCLSVMGAHPCPVHGDTAHGGEAEELRKGIEKILECSYDASRELSGDAICEALQKLLDDVDARDSLAWLERHDEKHEAQVAELTTRLASEYQRGLDDAEDAILRDYSTRAAMVGAIEALRNPVVESAEGKVAANG